MSIQIPDMHVSNPTKAKGKGIVLLPNRKDATHAGAFTLVIDVHFAPATDTYPVIGQLTLTKIDLVDSTIQGDVIATTIEQISSWGKYTPTLVVAGRCDVKANLEKPLVGCRYWLLLALNRSQAADVVSYIVYDRKGVRVSHATGAVSDGKFDITTSGE